MSHDPLRSQERMCHHPTEVENSEIAKRREAFERRLANIQRWGLKAHERAQRASSLAERLRQETKVHGDALYRRINGYICEYDQGDEREWRLQHRPVVKAMQAEADANLDVRWRRYERVRDRQDREATKHTRYCLEQCDLLRALAELEAKERAMYELKDGKDQCMTVLKLALANLTDVGAGALVSLVVRPRSLVATPPLLPLERHAFSGARMAWKWSCRHPMIASSSGIYEPSVNRSKGPVPFARWAASLFHHRETLPAQRASVSLVSAATWRNPAVSCSLRHRAGSEALPPDAPQSVLLRALLCWRMTVPLVHTVGSGVHGSEDAGSQPTTPGTRERGCPPARGDGD